MDFSIPALNIFSLFYHFLYVYRYNIHTYQTRKFIHFEILHIVFLKAVELTYRENSLFTVNKYFVGYGKINIYLGQIGFI